MLVGVCKFLKTNVMAALANLLHWSVLHARTQWVEREQEKPFQVSRRFQGLAEHAAGRLVHLVLQVKS